MSASKLRELSLEELGEKANSVDSLVIVCGAGLSFGVAPLAKDVEGGLIRAIEFLANKPTLSHPTPEEKEAGEEYFTLELFVSGLRHRVPTLEKPLRNLYEELFRLSTPNRAHRALATALKKFVSSGKRATVLTANFDDGITKSLVEAQTEHKLVTRNNVQRFLPPSGDRATMGQADRLQVCAYHGTVQQAARDEYGTLPSGPTSMTARNLAHPFPPFLSQYVQQTLADAGLVLFIGHRGEDFYDLNIELRRVAQSGGAGKDRFLCFPHMGNPKKVGSSYEALFGKASLIKIKDNITEDWIADLFDNISGEHTPTPDSLSAPLNLQQVTERFLGLVDKVYIPGSPERSIIQKQCAALLNDIRVGALAAWSVIEHYRLESIGYTQEEIAAFGRAPKKSRYYKVPIADLIDLQKDYQGFRNSFQSLEDHGTVQPGHPIIKEGLEVAKRLEDFASKARVALNDATEGTQKAITRLLAAIPYDYCGLVGMRLMKVIHVPPCPTDPLPSPAPLETLLGYIDAATMEKLASQPQSESGNGVGLRTELLFKASAALAREAGAELAAESAKFSSDPQTQKAYADNLAQIVGWQDWELAPTENRLRLSFVPVNERLKGYRVMINKRMRRMETEEAHASDERSFSAAADAAQCAVRVCEVARLLANVSDFGLIRPEPDVLALPEAQQFLEDIPEMARRCIKVASDTSSVHNHLIMQAYDALLLASMLNCQQILKQAAEYAEEGTGFQFERRLKGMKSRFLLLGTL